MRAKRIIALLLAGVLCVSALTGCGGIDKSATIATAGDTQVSLGMVNFYCRLQQATYEDIYKMYLGSDDVWTMDPYGSGTNMQDSVKESALEDLHEMYTLQAHMGDYGVSLTDDEKAAITEAATSFMTGNSKEALDELGATQEIVEEFLTLYTIRAKVEDAIKAEADVNVSDEEANMRGYTRLVVSTSSGSEELTEEELAAKKELAEQIASELAEEGATLESVAEAHELETSAQTYATYESADDTEEAEDDAVITALKGMQEGETSGMIEMDDGYYFVRVDNDTDAEATEDNRQSIITERQNEYYNETLEGWQADDGWEPDMELFAEIQFENSLTTTDPNAVEETENAGTADEEAPADVTKSAE